MIRFILEIYNKMPFYAVRVGKQPGIYNTWSECEAQVKRFPKASYKKFSSKKEAEEFINDHDKVGNCISKTFLPKKITSFKAKSVSLLSASTKTKLLSPKDVLVNTFSSRSISEIPIAPIVYTDGCCFGNGRSNPVGGIGVYWGPFHPKNISEPLEVERPTNQIAELRAASRALETAIQMQLSSIELRTDSKYTIKAMTEWIRKWEENGWKTAAGKDVMNQEELRRLSILCKEISVKWTHVAGHQGIHGNEEADKLAKRGADLLRL